ncbi:protein FAR1-RELATED SEQUENCE 5-like [Macadamia integrifolia]|uniref:protein FAR1-RELATED SEQUENCE 5-like n=1 Tax=Macadamia integrifolia TaxID=60698 RepID=UPI001C4F6A6E|nr:protein FAR1-RELATED SEQUENCE 5-like [Macadamia integrifolia]
MEDPMTAHWEIKPHVGMVFNSEQETYDFYNGYGRTKGFSVRRDWVQKSIKDNKTITSRVFVCNKQAKRKLDKRDDNIVTPRAETRTDCLAQMRIKLNIDGMYNCIEFVEEHNHEVHLPSTSHMMKSQRSVSKFHAFEIDLADDSGIRPKDMFEYMSRHVGGRQSIGHLKEDQKNYLRTKRQRDLHYGEAKSLLLFDTTFSTNKESRPFEIFARFNHHRGIVIFGAALLYDEAADSFKLLFEVFLEAHGQNKPITIFTDQDAAMGKALTEVLPNTWHILCIWRLMQNGIKNYGLHDEDDSKFLVDLKKCIFHYDDESQFEIAWYKLRSDHQHFERVVADKRANELKVEFDARNKLPRNLFIKSPVMNQRARVYTPKIFEKLQKEYEWIPACYIKKIIQNATYAYILRRWTRTTRNIVVHDIEGKVVVDDVHLDCSQRYMHICPKLVRIAAIASNSSEGYAYVDNVADKICKHLKSLNISFDGQDDERVLVKDTVVNNGLTLKKKKWSKRRW